VDVAYTYLNAELVERREHGWAKARHYALTALGAMFTGDLPATHDLVVYRRDTGAEVIRTPADIGDPEFLLEHVLDDLQTKTVSEFLTEWRLPDE
jgi:hypothetical protein